MKRINITEIRNHSCFTKNHPADLMEQWTTTQCDRYEEPWMRSCIFYTGWGDHTSKHIFFILRNISIQFILVSSSISQLCDCFIWFTCLFFRNHLIQNSLFFTDKDEDWTQARNIYVSLFWYWLRVTQVYFIRYIFIHHQFIYWWLLNTDKGQLCERASINKVHSLQNFYE